MTPRKIALGISIRLLVAIFLLFYMLIAATTVLQIDDAIVGGIIYAILVPAMIYAAVRLYRQDIKARFAIASIVANATIATCLLGNVIAFPSAATMIGAVLGAWQAFMTRQRWVQFKSGDYLRRFDPKPELPSPFAVLKREV